MDGEHPAVVTTIDGRSRVVGPVASFTIDARLDGERPRIDVNDQDVSQDAQEVQLRIGPDGVPQLWIRMVAGGTVEGDGIVHVVGDGEEIAAWLEQLDPAELEGAALNGLGMFEDPGPGGVARAVLATLVAWARDRPT